MKICIENGTVVTMNPKREIIKANVLIEDDRIMAIVNPAEAQPDVDKVIDAAGKVVIPGFVQTHVHLTQTLFRGFADDMELMDWLKKRIWPLEASHTAESNYYSAKLSLAELIRGGTTAIVDMETVHHTENAFMAMEESGIRALSGKCMMDHSPDVPKGLMEDMDTSIKESVRLLEKWHMRDGGRIRYAFNPRFAVSCSHELMVKVAQLAKQYDVYVHTHASENLGEIALVEKERGMRNVAYFHHIGLTSPKLILAHCIWLSDQELEILKHSGTKVSHCPTCNMKLASGIAKIPEMIAMGIDVALGADGAPCNNNLNMFTEMKAASLLQKVRLLSPTVLPAAKVFEMATLGGAKVMGLEHEIGSLEIGKKADVVILNLNKIHTTPSEQVDLISSIVYAAGPSEVETVVCNGRVLMEEGVLLTLNETEIIQKSKALALEKFKGL